MSNLYTGNPAGVNLATAIAVTEPADGDPLAAASVNAALSKLADLMAFTLPRSLTKGYSQQGPFQVDVFGAAVTPFSWNVGDLGQAGANQTYALVQAWSGAVAPGQQMFIYQKATGELVVAHNCTWTQASGWGRVDAAFDSTIATLGIATKFKRRLAASATPWLDTAWDQNIDLSGFGVTGDGFGISAGSTRFGRIMEVPTNITLAAGVTADGGNAVQSMRGPDGVVHLKGGCAIAAAPAGVSFPLGTIANGAHAPANGLLSYFPSVANFATLNPPRVPCTVVIGNDLSITAYLQSNTLPTGGGTVYLHGISYPT